MSDTILGAIIGGCIGLASSFLMLVFNEWIKSWGELNIFFKIPTDVCCNFSKVNEYEVSKNIKRSKAEVTLSLKMINSKKKKIFTYITAKLFYQGREVYPMVSKSEDSYMIEAESIMKIDLTFQTEVNYETSPSEVNEIDEVRLLFADEQNKIRCYKLLNLSDGWKTRVASSSNWEELEEV